MTANITQKCPFVKLKKKIYFSSPLHQAQTNRRPSTAPSSDQPVKLGYKYSTNLSTKLRPDLAPSLAPTLAPTLLSINN